MSISRSSARRLATSSIEMGAQVLRGLLTVGPEGLKVGEQDVVEWLAQHNGAELFLVAAPVDSTLFEDEVRSCYTCGRDYKGETCTHCAEVRARLRR